MKFTKMHGCGNDYIYVDCTAQDIGDRNAIAAKVSDRHFGIGSDGLICIDSSSVADFRMDMYNADGSQGKMCGNGIRCVGKFVYDHGMTQKTCITIETLGGIKTLHMQVKDGKVETVRVCMGEPGLTPESVPVLAEGDLFIDQVVTVQGKDYRTTCVSMGSAHAVTFVDDVEQVDLEKIGYDFEHHPLFPERINTEFVQVIDPEHLKMRVWERGSGETLACGTGSCATLVASALLGKSGNKATVLLRGGELFIEWDRETNLIYMTGPATTVFEGEIDL